MPFKSEKQRRWMYANHPEMAKRWQKHTPKNSKLPESVGKTAAFEPLQSVGAGVTRILGKFTPKQWASKINNLRMRAEFGDSSASDLLSIIGVASIVLGSGIGMFTGSKLGGRGGELFGSAVGGLAGAAPALMGGSEMPTPAIPSAPPKEPEPFDPTPWQKSELL